MLCYHLLKGPRLSLNYPYLLVNDSTFLMISEIIKNHYAGRIMAENNCECSVMLGDP